MPTTGKNPKKERKKKKKTRYESPAECKPGKYGKRRRKGRETAAGA